jgi:hypothetical protein
MVFCWRLEGQGQIAGFGSIGQKHGPLIRIRIRIRTKCHGSTTLLVSILTLQGHISSNPHLCSPPTHKVPQPQNFDLTVNHGETDMRRPRLKSLKGLGGGGEIC